MAKLMPNELAAYRTRSDQESRQLCATPERPFSVANPHVVVGVGSVVARQNPRFKRVACCLLLMFQTDPLRPNMMSQILRRECI